MSKIEKRQPYPFDFVLFPEGDKYGQDFFLITPTEREQDKERYAVAFRLFLSFAEEDGFFGFLGYLENECW